jgi:hypothetical protein
VKKLSPDAVYKWSWARKIWVSECTIPALVRLNLGLSHVVHPTPQQRARQLKELGNDLFKAKAFHKAATVYGETVGVLHVSRASSRLFACLWL